VARLDTRLEQEGAEFLVLGQLLIERVEAHKAYTRYPGYDIVALDPEHGTQCRIQVKSRWPSSANKFLIKNTECDFVVFVALNRGPKRSDPDFYVFPVEVVKRHGRGGGWGEVFLRDIEGLDRYRSAWHLITSALRPQS
jgi:hypothetical protein